MSFRQPSAAAPSQFAQPIPEVGEAAYALPPPDQGLISATLGDEPPTPIICGADARAWRHLLADVVYTQSVLRRSVLHQHPRMYAFVNERFARYDTLTCMLNNVLSSGFRPDQAQGFVSSIHQFRMALWSLFQLLHQCNQPSMPPLLNRMAASAEAATRLLRQLDERPSPGDSHHQMRYRLQSLLYKLDRSSTVESCESALAELDASRRQMQQEHMAQRLLPGFAELAPVYRRAPLWGWDELPQDVLALQAAYATPNAPLNTPLYRTPHGTPHGIAYGTSYEPSYGPLDAAARPTPSSVPQASPYAMPRHQPGGAPEARPYAAPRAGLHAASHVRSSLAPQAFPFSAPQPFPFSAPPVRAFTSAQANSQAALLAFHDAEPDAIFSAPLQDAPAAVPHGAHAPELAAAQDLTRGSGRPRHSTLPSADILRGVDDSSEPVRRGPKRKRPEAGAPAATKRPIGRPAARTAPSTATRTATPTHARTAVQGTDSDGSPASAPSPPGLTVEDDSQGSSTRTLVLPTPAAARDEALAYTDEESEQKVFQLPILVEID